MTASTTKYQRKHLRTILKSISKNSHSTREVVLNSIPFTEETTAALTSGLIGNTHVRILYLHNCQISPRGAHLLAYALRKNSSIEHLWLNGNKVGSSGAEAIAHALRENHTLKTLGLGDNNIGNHGGKRLNDTLRYNTSLTDVFLEGNRMSDRIVSEICRRCDKNRDGEGQDEEQQQEHADDSEKCQFSCGASFDPLEDLDASTVMSSITSSYTRKMLESIEEESEEDDNDDDDNSHATSSTVSDLDISCILSDLTKKEKGVDRLRKFKIIGRMFRR